MLVASMLQDLHTHTRFSPDSETVPEDVIRAAENAGLARVAITDHLDLDDYCKNKSQYEQNLKEYSTEIPKLKEHSAVKVLYGIEFGNANYDYNSAERLLDSYKFEFVLLSLHSLKNEQGFHLLNFTKDNSYDYFKRYFNELYEMIVWAKKNVKINAIAHLTYPFRYASGNFCSADRFSRETDDIFKEIISGQIALEINTAGLRQKDYARTDPPAELIERYFSLGGKLITTGSDAHKSEEVAQLSDVANRYSETAYTKIGVRLNP
jgi:histidinol-phosphatase (PHP family)